MKTETHLPDSIKNMEYTKKDILNVVFSANVFDWRNLLIG